MVPKLRFESYFDNWLSNKLSDLAVDNTLSNGVFNDPLNVGSGYKLINVVNMYKEPCIDENDLSLLTLDEKTFRKNQVFFGDVFFTRSSLVKEGIAWSNIYLGHSEDVTFDGHLIKLTPDLRKINPKFLYFCLKTSLVRKQLIESGKTATMTTIGQSDVGKTLAFIPQLEEQTKIADFLSSVDEKITLLNKQYDLLCQYKKGMMQKIFSQKYRFKDGGEKDFPEWGEVTLENIGSFFSGGTPTSTNRNYYNGVIPFIRSAEINSDSTELFISEEGLNSSSAKLVNKGDILYALYGATSGEVGISKIHGAINQAILCIRSTLNTSFLYYFLKSSKEQIVSTYIQGGQGNLSAEIIRKLKVPTPSIGEQTKIANFLSSLDDKIAAKKAELDKLKTWKQGLLQQMFV
ncbi:restriction endonuclease subunit S [Enterobacter roggenkampii]|uniref:restriction endonuclease subunit S n=1 Tax=Enterobacter roggenkampii TaxID=1812935 RepID=UPI00240D7CD6|nr:restriction endonuclease subunit S [Enterobacter roggenkampii]WFC86311.1 restriction endonuclease subunit S [Enterobacter roggenkampii]